MGNFLEIQEMIINLVLLAGYSIEAAVWENWSEWSGCSKSCGVGDKFRARKCLGGSRGDPGCKGRLKEWDSCQISDCSDNGGKSDVLLKSSRGFNVPPVGESRNRVRTGGSKQIFCPDDRCPDGSMCNYDYGDAGFCEDCSNYPTKQACIDTGFTTQRGTDECFAICNCASDWFAVINFYIMGPGSAFYNDYTDAA